MTRYGEREAIDMLRRVAQVMESFDKPSLWGLVLSQEFGKGRFPFEGGGTELLNATPDHRTYMVPASRVLTVIAKAVKEAELNEQV